MPPVKDGTRSIGRQVAAGAGWTVSLRLTLRGIGLASTVVLARLLVPEDFGLVAMAMLLYGILEILSEFSSETVLLIRQEAGADYYDTVWTLSVLRGVIIAGLLCLLAGPTAEFFWEARIERIVYLLALVALLQGLSNVGVIDFQRELNFGMDFAYGLAVKLCSFVATVVLAFVLRSYLALVIGIVVAAVARVALSYAMHPYRPTLTLARWREILGFSTWLYLSNVLSAAYRRTDTFLISKLVGAGALGVYSIAHEISSLPVSELVVPARRAILAGWAKMAHESEELRTSFVDSFALIFLFAVPVAAGIGLTADPAVRLFLGGKWVDAIPLIEILALVGLFRACSANASPMYLALGQPRLNAVIMGVGAVVGVPLLTWGTYRWGVVGTAWAMTLAAAIHSGITLAVAIRILQLSPWTLLVAVWRSAAAAAAMTALVFVVGQSWPDADSQAAFATKLVALAAVGAASYGVVHLGLWRLCGRPDGAESQVLGVLQRRQSVSSVKS